MFFASAQANLVGELILFMPEGKPLRCCLPVPQLSGNLQGNTLLPNNMPLDFTTPSSSILSNFFL